MKILLVNLPWKSGNLWGVRAGSRWPHIKTVPERGYLPYPFFLAYSAALLKKEGFEVRLIDALAEELPPKLFLKKVAFEKPDLLVAETSTPSLLNDLEILRSLPAEMAIALCGPEANIRDTEFISKYKFIDYVFVGEYEFTLLELVQRLQSNSSLDNLCGLMFRKGGILKENPSRELLEDLDLLPWPLRVDLPMGKYNDTPGGIPSPSVQMWSSRGCPYQCAFCLWPQLMYKMNRYRIRSIIKVVDEMEYLVNKMGFKSVYFDDDTTNIGKLRMMGLSDEIKRRHLNVPWAMMARADLMDEEILEALRSSGLAAVKYGVESAEQSILDRIGKNMDIRKVERMVRFTKSIGIKTHLTFSFGLPGETQDTIKKTIDLAMVLDPDSLQFSIATAFPGTSYFQTLDSRGHILSRIFTDYDGNHKSMLRTDSLMPGDLEKARREADKMWQEHVWKTRRSASSYGFWYKVIKTINQRGIQFVMPRVFPFIRNKLLTLSGSFGTKLLGTFSRFHIFRTKTNAIRKEIVNRTRKNYLNLLGIFSGSYAFKGPDCVQIDLTNRCNNNCICCWCNSPLLGEKAYKGSMKDRTLPINLVKSVIDELAELGTSELYFSGGGEPFMHPDLLNIVGYAKSKGMCCAINTNFTLVNELMVKRIIEVGIDALTVSVWAANPKTYVSTHPNKDEAMFHRIKCTLKMLNSLKEASHPHVKVYNVISNLNCRELVQMVEFAEEVGAESVEFTVVDTMPGTTDSLLLDASQRRSVLEQCEYILRRSSKVQVLNLEHFMRRLSDAGAGKALYDSSFLKHCPCYVGWVFSRIMPNGDVNFCLKAHRIPVGSLYRNSFSEIWNSKEQRDFRSRALKHDINDSFFRGMGNDDKCEMGCYKSCDNLGHNHQVERVITSLSPLQLHIIKVHSFFMRMNKKIK